MGIISKLLKYKLAKEAGRIVIGMIKNRSAVKRNPAHRASEKKEYDHIKNREL